MITKFVGIQGCGKSMLAAATVFKLVQDHGYAPEEVVTNMALKMDRATVLNNQQIRTYIGNLAKGNQLHQVILIDEIDSVFPSRYFKDKAQTEALIGLWQDEKRFNWVLYTCHYGTSIDAIIRAATQKVIFPYYKGGDSCPYYLIDGINATTSWQTFEGCYHAQTLYDRWEIIL